VNDWRAAVTTARGAGRLTAVWRGCPGDMARQFAHGKSPHHGAAHLIIFVKAKSAEYDNLS
jgi:hypothetical protein